MIWIQTLEGCAFDLLNPTPEMISWRTVAIVLSRTSRFGGHTLLGPYSVAQHCVEGARAILRDTGRRDWAAAFLLHDVHEAYIGDIMTPVAKAIGALATELYGDMTGELFVDYAIKELKRRIDVAVHAKAGITVDDEAAGVVKEYDYRMAVTERSERLAPYPMPWYPSIEQQRPVEGCDLTPWGEALAAALWTTAFLELVRPVGSEVAIPAPGDDACGCGAGCGDDVVTPWSTQGWPDSPAPLVCDCGLEPLSTQPYGICDNRVHVAPCDGVYRKEIEPIWR